MPPSPPSRSNPFLWLSAAAAVVFWVTWTALDVRIGWRDEAAHASGLSLSECVRRAVDDAARRDEHREKSQELRRTE